MGDTLVQQPIKTLSTTDVQIGGVYDSTGTNALAIDSSGRIPVKTLNLGDVAAKIVDAGGTNELAVDSSGRVTSNQGAAAALSAAWPVEMTDGTNILGTSTHPVRVDPTGTTTQPISGTVTANQGTANTIANAWPIKITDGTNTVAVTASGKINVATLADNTNGSAVTTTGFMVGGSDGTNFRFLKTAADGTLYVNDQTSPGTPKTSGALTHATLAPGGSATLAAADITTGKTGYLKRYTASASGPIKIVLQTVTGGTGTGVSTNFTSASDPSFRDNFENDEVTEAGGTGNHFAVVITNQDNHQTFDVYADFSWVEL